MEVLTFTRREPQQVDTFLSEEVVEPFLKKCVSAMIGENLTVVQSDGAIRIHGAIWTFMRE